MEFSYWAEIMILAMLMIAFIQSGLDKAVHRKDNLAYFQHVFKNVPLMKAQPKSLLLTITLLELLSGILALIGILSLLFYNDSYFGKMAGISSSITLLSLFFGQRLAKDYNGAMVIVVYLIPCFFLLYLTK